MSCKKITASDNVYRNLSIVTVIINIALLGVALTITLLWRGQLQDLDNYKFQTKTHCVVCDYDLPKNSEVFKNGTKCCAKAKDLLDLHLKKKIQQRAEEEQRRFLGYRSYGLMHCDESKGTSKPARRVNGTKSQDKNGLMLWKGDNGTKNNVTYNEENGSFYVEHNAFYYVYSQITLIKDQSTNTSFCQAIYRQNGSPKTKLLESCLPNCKMITDEGRATSFVGGTVILKAKDRVFVEVSKEAEICSDESESKKCQTGNFFGIHMV